MAINFNKLQKAVQSPATMIDNIDHFTSLSMNQSKTLFKKCLGTEFPFDVIQAAMDFTKSLSNVLNAGLDGALCGSSVGQVSASTKSLSDAIMNNDLTNKLFPNEEEKTEYLKNGGSTEHTIYNNDWVKTHKKDTTPAGFTEILRYPANIGATAVDISLVSPSISISTENGHKIITASGEVVININGLLCGPNDGRTEATDATNLIGNCSGTWKKKFNIKGVINNSTGQAIQVGQVSNIPITITKSNGAPTEIYPTVSLTYYDIDARNDASLINWKTNLNISKLYYKTGWSNLSDGSKTTAEKNAESNGIKAQNEASKLKAQQAFKNSVMTSSLLDNAIKTGLEETGLTDPKFGINATDLTSSVKQSFANNAINLVNGDNLVIDQTLYGSLAGGLMSTATKNLAEKTGLPVNISRACTKQLLDKLGAKWEFENPFGDLMPNMNQAYAFADNVTNKMKSLMDNLLSADCIKAVNNQFDICNEHLSNYVAHTVGR